MFTWTEGNEVLTVQSHVVVGEDDWSVPFGNPLHGAVDSSIRSLHVVLLQDVRANSLHRCYFLPFAFKFQTIEINIHQHQHPSSITFFSALLNFLFAFFNLRPDSRLH